MCSSSQDFPIDPFPMSQKEQGHLVLPWRVVECEPGAWPDEDRCDGIRDADDRPVVTTDSGVYGPDLPTARYIVQACNAFPELIAALQLVMRCDELIDCFAGNEHIRGHVRDLLKKQADPQALSREVEK